MDFYFVSVSPCRDGKSCFPVYAGDSGGSLLPVLQGIELFVHRFTGTTLRLSWSAVVLTACGIIVAALVTILSKRRLRDAVQRRLHF